MAEVDTVQAETGPEVSMWEGLERRVEEAIRRIRQLQDERNKLREELENGQGRIEGLERELEQSRSSDETVRRLRQENDALLRARAATAQRVERILERLEAAGLD